MHRVENELKVYMTPVVVRKVTNHY